MNFMYVGEGTYHVLQATTNWAQFHAGEIFRETNNEAS